MVLALSGAAAVMMAVIWRSGWSSSSTIPAPSDAGVDRSRAINSRAAYASATDVDRVWTTTVSALRAAPPGHLTIVDVRSAWDYGRSHVPGAVRVSWLDYRDGWGRTGKLDSDVDRIARDMAKVGVDSTRSVVVYGNARDGWGEEGRIAWMLHYLGHPDVTILDGGWPAWQRAGWPTERETPKPVPGQFSAHLRPEVRASTEDVARASSARVSSSVSSSASVSSSSSSAVILDTRSTGEWNGSGKYFPARVGRIPGAVHIEWQDLLTADGYVDRSPEQRERLRALGLTPERPVIAYCVGGVRSGEAFYVLKALGFHDVRNYDGSWYEWAADRERPIERDSSS